MGNVLDAGPPDEEPIEVPFLAVGINYDEGFTFSHVITQPMTEDELRSFMTILGNLDEILVVKNDQVVAVVGTP